MKIGEWITCIVICVVLPAILIMYAHAWNGFWCTYFERQIDTEIQDIRHQHLHEHGVEHTHLVLEEVD